MKKIIVLLFIISFISCDSLFQLSPDIELAHKIRLEYLKEKQPVDLKKITDFDWDHYLIIFVYEVPSYVGKKYNVDLSNMPEHGACDEGQFTLVFIKNRKALKYCDLSCAVGIDRNKILIIKK